MPTTAERHGAPQCLPDGSARNRRELLEIGKLMARRAARESVQDVTAKR